MRTARNSGLLIALLTFVALFPGVAGRAAADSPIVDAAKRGDEAAVRALIAKKANVNIRGNDGSSALLWATYNDDVEMVRALIAAGAEVNAPNHYGITPLIQASRTGDAAVIDALLKAGADPRLNHPQGETPLMAASKTGRVDAVKLSLAMKVGERDNLDGSVTASDSKSQPEELGIHVDKRKIDLAEPIRELGEYNVGIKIHPEVRPEVRITVVKE